MNGQTIATNDGMTGTIVGQTACFVDVHMTTTTGTAVWRFSKKTGKQWGTPTRQIVTWDVQTDPVPTRTEYTADTLRQAVPDHKTVNRYVNGTDGERYLVFGMTDEWVLVQQCFTSIDGRAMVHPISRMSFDCVASVVPPAPTTTTDIAPGVRLYDPAGRYGTVTGCNEDGIAVAWDNGPSRTYTPQQLTNLGVRSYLRPSDRPGAMELANKLIVQEEQRDPPTSIITGQPIPNGYLQHRTATRLADDPRRPTGPTDNRRPFTPSPFPIRRQCPIVDPRYNHPAITVTRFDGAEGPACFRVPTLPAGCTSVDMTPTGIYTSGHINRPKGCRWRAFKLTRIGWVKLTGDDAVDFEMRSPIDETEYTR